MANRDFKPVQALEREAKLLFANISIAAAGVPTLTKMLGIASIVRSGAGAYDVVLQDSYFDLLGFSIIQELAANQDLNFQLTAVDVAAKTFSFVCKTGNVSTDPTTGTVLRLGLVVKNSSVVY